MNEPSHDRLREAGWRRKLNASETEALQAWLAAHPEDRADWELEAKLNEALERLADVPVSTNFTARVLQAVERDLTAASRSRGFSRLWHSLLPKAAFAALLLCVGLVAYHRTETAVERVRLAQSVATVSELKSVPSPEILRDLEAIRQLPPATSVDPGLLTVFSLLQ